MLDLAQLQKSWAGEQPESQLSHFFYEIELEGCGCNSAVECQLPKLNVAGSNPVTRLNQWGDKNQLPINFDCPSLKLMLLV